jgi:hydroxypyruvate reductase
MSAGALPEPPRHGRTIVIGAGKARRRWHTRLNNTGKGELSGLVVTRYGHGVPCEKIEVIEAAHPVPDIAGQQAAARILDMVQGLTKDDLVLCLISGGGSALLALPAEGITLEQKQAINKALLKSGAAISEMNCVRKHLSAIKGGRLGLACAPARVITLMISDVPGDDASIIASGPTLPDDTTCGDALAILRKYAIAILTISKPICSPGREKHRNPATRVSPATNITSSLLPARAGCGGVSGQNHGCCSPYYRMASKARRVISASCMRHWHCRSPVKASHSPSLASFLSGGETTVTVHGNGRGGRNAEFLLSLAVALNGCPNIYALACDDTDGIDGSEDNAGAYYEPASAQRAMTLNLSPKKMLENNDGRLFFALGDLIVSGPTRTNVNDFRVILVL